MTMLQGQYQETCVRRTIPHKYVICGLLSTALLVWVLAVPSRRSYAIKSVIDQCQDQGYTDGMIREVSNLFPDSRALLRARDLSVPPAPLAAQALSDYDKKTLEDRFYQSILSRLNADGMDVATLLVSYLGQMRFKVVLAVRTKELPYPKIRQTLEKLRTVIEKDIFIEAFKGFELAELSSFTVLNRRNGRFYEYPVLYQNMALPLHSQEQHCDGEPAEGGRAGSRDGSPWVNMRPGSAGCRPGESNGPIPKPIEKPAVPLQSQQRGTKPRFPWGDRPWEAPRSGVDSGSSTVK